MNKIRLLFACLTISVALTTLAALPPMPVLSEPTPVMATKADPVSVTQSDSAVIIAIGTSAIALIGVIFNGFMAFLMAKLNNKAGRVEDQAAATAAKSDETLEVVKVVHALVNNNMRVALADAYDFAQRLADITRKPADRALAAKARLRLKEHDAGQAVADNGAAARKGNRRKDD